MGEDFIIPIKLLFTCLMFSTLPLSVMALECTPFKVLDKKTEQCSDNHYYVDAGRACLKKLEVKISSATHGALDEFNEKRVLSLSKKQKEDLDASSQYVKKVLRVYRDNIFYPEEWDGPEEIIGDRTDYINSQRCYSQANEALMKLEATLSHYIKNLVSKKKDK